MLIKASEAIAHLRLDSDYPVEQVQPYIDAAVSYVQAHLNRNVYPDQQQLDDARNAAIDAAVAADTAYSETLDEVGEIESAQERSLKKQAARQRLEDAKREANRAIHGMVVNSTIKGAMLLTLGNLFENREAVVVGASAAELPQGVPALLRPFRLVQMP